MSSLARWRGLCALIADAVEHGATEVERIHLATARRPFQILERIAPVAAPTRLVREVHDAIVTHTYGQVRFWNATVRTVVQAVLPQAPTQAPTVDVQDEAPHGS